MFCLKEGLVKKFTSIVLVSTLCVALNFGLLDNELVAESTTLLAASTFSKDIDKGVNDECRT